VSTRFKGKPHASFVTAVTSSCRLSRAALSALRTRALRAASVSHARGGANSRNVLGKSPQPRARA
jgi:hypothetical protein